MRRDSRVQSDDHDPPGVVRVRAPNPSLLTLDGTNTYVAEGWVVDPGPDMEVHLDAVLAAAGGRIEGIALTHSHADHADGAGPLAVRAGAVPVVLPGDGVQVGPFRALATPGHAPDHVCLLLGRTCFTGDAVLGEGSVFIAPGEGSLAAHLDSLRRLRALDLELLCPGHGPYVRDPAAKLDDYIAHRLERERLLVEALGAGARTESELLDRAWSEVAPGLRPAAALTLRAHLEKLAGEGRLPADLEPGLRE
ncbi:MAG: MBL fold metallo-hydrolase [Thermoleophilaceae bacterium]|nr:MBL fold metallo-hydrolase [Thermoleophilaceae bacterium]